MKAKSLIQAWEPSLLYLLQKFFTEEQWKRLAGLILNEFPPLGKMQKRYLEKLAPTDVDLTGNFAEFLSFIEKSIHSAKKNSKFTSEFFSMHPATSDELLEKILREGYVNVVLSKRNSLKSELIEKLISLNEPSVRCNLLQHQMLTIEQCSSIYETLIEDWEYRHYARYANATEEIFRTLNQSDVPYIRNYLAKNRFLSDLLLAQLANDEDEKVRSSALANPSLGEDAQISILEKHPTLIDLMHLAGNSNADSKVLQEIYSRIKSEPSSTQVHFVRLAIVRNRNCTPELMSKICNGAEADDIWTTELVEEIVKSPNCPAHFLVPYFHRVAAWAGEKAIRGGALVDWALPSREALAKNLICPMEILQELSCHPEASIRASVAKNENSTPELLDRFRSERSKVVLENLAANENAKPDLLSFVWRKKVNQTRKMAQRIHSNPNCDEKTRELIKERFGFGDDEAMFNIYAAELVSL